MTNLLHDSIKNIIKKINKCKYKKAIKALRNLEIVLCYYQIKPNVKILTPEAELDKERAELNERWETLRQKEQELIQKERELEEDRQAMING